MTTTDDIKVMLESCIPEDMRADGLVDSNMVKLGVIDACCALGIGNLEFEEIEDPSAEEGADVVYSISPDLTLAQQRLAGYFGYILYLEKLKLSLNQDAINFSTLTFSIKGLEKRPEAVNDQIYLAKRYLEDQVNMLNGSAAIVGTAVQFGGGSDD